jgi:hypothetical protein
MPTGTVIGYVAATGHRPIPRAADLLYRHAHQPQVSKVSSTLDWSALTPACTGCGHRSGRLNGADLCPTCSPPRRRRGGNDFPGADVSPVEEGRLAAVTEGEAVQQPATRPSKGKQRLTDLGVSSLEVKEWALGEGLIYGIEVGLPPARLVDAYAAAHDLEEAS